MIATILDHLRKLSKPVDFPPNKLKSGSGEHVLVVLDLAAGKRAPGRFGLFGEERPGLVGGGGVWRLRVGADEDLLGEAELGGRWRRLAPSVATMSSAWARWGAS